LRGKLGVAVGWWAPVSDSSDRMKGGENKIEVAEERWGVRRRGGGEWRGSLRGSDYTT